MLTSLNLRRPDLGLSVWRVPGLEQEERRKEKEPKLGFKAGLGAGRTMQGSGTDHMREQQGHRECRLDN